MAGVAQSELRDGADSVDMQQDSANWLMTRTKQHIKYINQSAMTEALTLYKLPALIVATLVQTDSPSTIRVPRWWLVKDISGFLDGAPPEGTVLPATIGTSTVDTFPDITVVCTSMSASPRRLLSTVAVAVTSTECGGSGWSGTGAEARCGSSKSGTRRALSEASVASKCRWAGWTDCEYEDVATGWIKNE